MTTSVSIIIPAHNERDCCEQCITALRANTPEPHRLILVDNGSTDGVAELFDAVPEAIVVRSPTNRGFAGGVNLGLERAEGHVILLNSDTLVPVGWLSPLMNALLRADDVGMVGPMSNCVSGPQQIDGLEFESLDAINAYANALAQERAGRCRDVERLVGFCLLIRDRVVEQVGPFDERYGIGNFEDDDYCRRARDAGYRLCIAEDAFVFHYGSRTFQAMGVTGERWHSLMEENQQKYAEKWQETPSLRLKSLHESQRLNAEARTSLQSGRTTDALALLKRAIAACPALEMNYNDLGVVLWEMGERKRAYEYVSRAARMNPDYEEARANLRDMAAAMGTTHEH